MGKRKSEWLPTAGCLQPVRNSLSAWQRRKPTMRTISNPMTIGNLPGLYYDEGISGTKKEKRDGLLAMVAACERGMIDFVITKSISRFARNTTDCLELVRKLLDLNIYIYFEKENINTGSMESELMLST